MILKHFKRINVYFLDAIGLVLQFYNKFIRDGLNLLFNLPKTLIYLFIMQRKAKTLIILTRVINEEIVLSFF